MIKFFVLLMLSFVSLFANTTIYTEGRYYSTIDSAGIETPTDSTVEDRSRFSFDENGLSYTHRTTGGSVTESTYWVEDGSTTLLDNGFICNVTSDAGNYYTVFFLQNVVAYILKKYDNGSCDIIRFRVKNIVK